MKLRKIAKVTPHRPGVHLIRFAFDRRMTNYLKQFPGCRYAPEFGGDPWVLPEELLNVVRPSFDACGFDVKVDLPLRIVPKIDDPLLRPYQQRTSEVTLSNRRRLISYEMGLGKTITALRTLAADNAQRILVVRPKMTRSTWVEEPAKFWPTQKVFLIETGKEAREYGSSLDDGIYLLTYGLMDQLLESEFVVEWDAIVFDEIHYLSNPKSGWSETANTLLTFLRPNGLQIGLTGTPIANEPHNAWNPLNWLFPDRFGSYWKFAYRYCRVVDNDYGHPVIKGLIDDEARQQELQMRLAAVMCREVRSDHPEYISALDVQPVFLKPARCDLDELLTITDPKEFNEAAVPFKVQSTVERVQEELKSTSHVCVVTDLRVTAERIAEQLGPIACHVDGSLSAKKREAVIKECLNRDTGVLVATMHSVKEGINYMTRFPVCYFAELYWRMLTVLQMMGRFGRTPDSPSSRIYTLVVQGTVDEAMAHVLEKRTRQAKLLIKAGQAETGLLDGVTRANMSDEDFLKEIQEVISARRTEDEF